MTGVTASNPSARAETHRLRGVRRGNCGQRSMLCTASVSRLAKRERARRCERRKMKSRRVRRRISEHNEMRNASCS